MADNTNSVCKAIRFSLNGPIRTGIYLDTRRLIGDGAEDILTELKGKLTSLGPGWTVYAPRSNGLDISIETRRESIVKPPYLAKYSFDAHEFAFIGQALRESISDSQSASFIENILLKTLHLRFFSFGYATFYAEFGLIEENHNLSLKSLRTNVEPLSREEVIGHFKHLFFEQIEKFRSVAGAVEEKLPENVKWKGKDQPEQAMKHSGDGALPRWAHRIYGLQCGDNDGVEEASRGIEDLIYTSSDTELKNLYPREGASIYVSSGNSALFSIDPEAESARKNANEIPDVELAWKNLNEIVEFQNAFFARAEDLDEYLLYLVNRISLDKMRVRQNRKLFKAMDSYAIDIVDTREEVLIFKNDVSDYEGHLDPDSKKIWAGLWEQWDTGGKFNHIERQIDIMGGLYDRIVTLLNQNQTKRLSTFALIFTLLSGLAAFVDTCSFMRSPSLLASSIDVTNTVLVVALILLLVFIFWRIMRR